MAQTTPRRTKIVATIGPATASPERVRALMDAGMDAARLNLSHGTHDDHSQTATLVREAADRAGKPVAVIGDLQGPKLRVGSLEAPLHLEQGTEVIVVCGDGLTPHDGELQIAPSAIGEVLRPGHEVLIDDGHVRLVVERVEERHAVCAVVCAVVVGGVVTSHKGVNLPGVKLPVPSLTRKDLADLELALSLGVDFVAL